MKKSFKPILLIYLLTAACFTPLLRGTDNIVVQLRLYEGYKKKGKVSAVVVSSYYLKKLAKEQLLSDKQIAMEKNSLQKIYNLEEVRDISVIDMTLKKGGENTQEIVLAGRELVVKLAMFPKDTNRFKVRVLEKGKKAALMETEIIIPQEKAAVLGFEDATKRVFFFSFHRQKDSPADKKSPPIAWIKKPYLIKRVVPPYPDQVLAEGIEGDVVIRALINKKGNLTQLRVEESLHPLLDQAALDAVSQWKYNPLMTHEGPREQEVSVKITFKIKEDQQKNE